MPLFWFMAGTLTTLATLIVMLPQLRKMARFAALPALPWQASVAAIVIVVATFGLHTWLGGARSTVRTASSANAVSTPAGSAFTDATKAFANANGEAAGSSGSPAQKSSAGSMNSAIANLESRLAKGGGTDGDWELLAKSFEFLGRPADAAQARARKLPPLPADSDASAPPSTAMMSPAPLASSAPAASAPAAAGTAVSGEISLAPALKAKAAAGETLFIVAKSVDAPGAPVAVYRGSVGSWPLKFTLDDSQSMLPGRNLSTAGRVTIEARISQKGQPLPASGDLQGSTGVINPADHQPLKILIDRVIT
jgi:cytochrome c-type biogenesis protein CcmH